MNNYDEKRDEIQDRMVSALFAAHREAVYDVDVADFTDDLSEAAAIVIVASFELQSVRESWNREELIQRIEAKVEHFSEMLQKTMRTEMIKDDNQN